ncbi:MAG: M28 family peptidase, partial [Gammaproteobacteria bacterium]
MKRFLACLLLGASTTVYAQAPDAVIEAAASMRDRALEENRAYDTLTSLLTEVGPRFAGTPGDAAAVAWALRTLRDAGLHNVRAEPVEVPRWVRGEVEVEITGPFPQPLVALALGGSVGTPDEGIEAPVLMVTDPDALRALPESEVAGKIVFYNRRMEREQDGTGYGRTVRNRGEGAAVAAQRGAVGVVIRSVGTSNARVAHTGSMRYQDAIAQIPAAAISNPDADTLQRQVDSGRQVTLRMHLTSRMLGTARSANVVGEIPGRGPRANEIVLLGAHLDSWDITPGAHDDGAGVAIVIEAARMIGAQRRNP